MGSLRPVFDIGRNFLLDEIPDGAANQACVLPSADRQLRRNQDDQTDPAFEIS